MVFVDYVDLGVSRVLGPMLSRVSERLPTERKIGTPWCIVALGWGPH
jgi:hypothetical protein